MLLQCKTHNHCLMAEIEADVIYHVSPCWECLEDSWEAGKEYINADAYDEGYSDGYSAGLIKGDDTTER